MPPYLYSAAYGLMVVLTSLELFKGWMLHPGGRCILITQLINVAKSHACFHHRF